MTRPAGVPVPFRVLVAALAMMALSGCGAGRGPAPREIGFGRPMQEGLASFYAEEYHGRRTASGEIYDMRQLTAAHPTLPFGTRVRVTRLDSGRQVVVRVNDRGPFVQGRIIDLSLAAARELRMVEQGLAKVRIETVAP